MKKAILILLLSIVLQPLATQASSKTDDPKSEFTAKVNGIEWKAGIVGCNVEISSVEFFGMGMDNTGLKIFLDAPAAEGTFEISKKSKHKISYGSTEENYTIGANDAGKVIVTKYDASRKLFSGTFEFTLTHEKTGKKVKITDGVFTNLQFHDKPKTDWEFKAKLNGAKWKWTAASGGVWRDTASVSVVGPGKLFLYLQFPGNTPPGEYNIAADGDIYAYYKSFQDKDDVGLKAKNGKLIILENDEKKRKISGRFEIEMINETGETKARFTDGSFTMFYQK